MLARALRDVVGGFYIDVGSWEPWRDSVTAHFYLSGWTGVNIEPVPRYAEELRRARQRDVVIEAAVDRAEGVRILHLFDGSGCSTVQLTWNEIPSQLDLHPRSVIEVNTVTLTSIFEQYAPADVHFLKIDCEGSEESALAGLDLGKFRPWIILVEATAPLTQIPAFQAWEPLLLEGGYCFVYFDGLNRFYVSKEKMCSLKDAFAAPPNVFDQIEFAKYRDEMELLKSENEALRKRLAELENISSR